MCLSIFNKYKHNLSKLCLVQSYDEMILNINIFNLRMQHSFLGNIGDISITTKTGIEYLAGIPNQHTCASFTIIAYNNFLHPWAQFVQWKWWLFIMPRDQIGSHKEQPPKVSFLSVASLTKSKSEKPAISALVSYG